MEIAHRSQRQWKRQTNCKVSYFGWGLIFGSIYIYVHMCETVNYLWDGNQGMFGKGVETYRDSAAKRKSLHANLMLLYKLNNS